MAPQVGVTERLARARTRMLLRNVNGSPVFAFGGTRGRVCFFVWPGGGRCGAVSAKQDSIWIVNSFPHMRQAVVGVVSDRVRAVDVSIRGKLVRVKVRNNAFAAPFTLKRGERMPLPSVEAITG